LDEVDLKKATELVALLFLIREVLASILDTGAYCSVSSYCSLFHSLKEDVRSTLN
jgi:hypothetical protein